MIKAMNAMKMIKGKKAEMDMFFKMLLWVIVFALLASGVYFLVKRLAQ